MSEKRVCLGKIVGVHGIRGEVKVKSYTAVDKDIAAYGELEDKAAGKRFSLKVTGHSKDLLRHIAFVKGQHFGTPALEPDFQNISGAEIIKTDNFGNFGLFSIEHFHTDQIRFVINLFRF